MLIQSLQALRSRFILLVNSFRGAPVPIPRSETELKALARETRGLALYYSQACPESIRACRSVRHLNLPLECRNIRRSQVHRDDLVAGLGRLSTPCLKVVEEGRVSWICGEVEVNHYLQGRFAPGETVRAA